MSLELFTITDTNPNDTCGGGGCACSPIKVKDCKGPYAVFRGPATDFHLSPHNVIGAKCLRVAAERLDGEVLASGEKGYVEPEEDVVERFNVKPTPRKAPARKASIPKV